MPYKTGDQVTYSSATDSLLFTINQSKVFHTGKMPQNEKCECENNYTVILSSDSVRISMFFPYDTDAGSCHICLNNECLSFFESHEQYVWNGITYRNVKIFRNKSMTSTDVFERVILVRQLGIAAIIRKTDTLQTSQPAILLIDKESVEFVTEDC
jgi:hypothetical protein